MSLMSWQVYVSDCFSTDKYMFQYGRIYIYIYISYTYVRAHMFIHTDRYVYTHIYIHKQSYTYIKFHKPEISYSTWNKLFWDSCLPNHHSSDVAGGCYYLSMKRLNWMTCIWYWIRLCMCSFPFTFSTAPAHRIYSSMFNVNFAIAAASWKGVQISLPSCSNSPGKYWKPWTKDKSPTA